MKGYICHGPDRTAMRNDKSIGGERDATAEAMADPGQDDRQEPYPRRREYSCL